MIPPTAASPTILGYFCTDEGPIFALETISCGYPLPENVLRDIDPYQLNPSNLPDSIWYYVKCDANTGSSFGHWKPKGEACKVYSSSSFTGWRTILEFYEGQAPHEQKTAWVMHKYWISQTDFDESSKKKEANSLCKVFLGDERFSNHGMIKKLDVSIISDAEHINPNQLVVPDASINMANGSTSRSQISEDDKMVELAVAGKLYDHHSERLPEMDYLSRGDYLEMLDLVEPASPSSSENSSCLTMSSDEYFDSLALLQDIERDINLDKVQRGAACKSASFRLDMVVHEGASDSFISSRGNNLHAEENLRIDCPVPGSSASSSSEVSKERDIKYLSQSQKAGGPRFKGPSSSSHAQVVVSKGKETDVNEEKKGPKKVKKKYLCFMPF